MAQLARNWDVDAAAHTLKFVQLLLSDFHPRNFTVELWNGISLPPEEKQFHRFTWKINNPVALRKALFASNRELTLARAYIAEDFDILGDLQAIFPLADYLIHKQWPTHTKLRLLQMGLGLRGRGNETGLREVVLTGGQHSLARDQQAIRYHYDVSNRFYALWLDRNMIYSCAYFDRPEEDIETAQLRKLDSICRNLRLRPGETLLDIGCGWGGLIIHAARAYGVTAKGITLSQQQFGWAQARIRELGLADRCSVQLMDYRKVDGVFDKLASIGMVEHVGIAQLPEYFRKAFRLLRPGGMFLNSGIAVPESRQEFSDFTDAYIFPDGELASIATLLSSAERAGFEVLRMENLREHYMHTVRHWLDRLQAHADEARAVVGRIKERMWRLYLAGSAFYFERGRLNLCQTLFRKPEVNAV
jgi:cyclopropane-fatty-acyl-phospholipid synthase